jgi:hypothetical protein
MKTQQQSGEGELRDTGVRGNARETWLLRALLAVTSVSLLATSPPELYFYSFERTLTVPSFTLTADRPARAFLISVRATELGTMNQPTTNSARIEASGSLVTTGATARFVSVRLRGDGASGSDGTSGQTAGQPGAQLQVATQFALSDELVFTGNCADPSQGDCRATAVVELARTDGGGEGTISVDWTVQLRSQALKGEKGPSEGPLDPPWDVTVSEL